ncbi:MAG: hypothetical protein U0166_14980 [Acidobacteriota bacterium]
MNDDRLRELLKRVDGIDASEGFARRVMASLPAGGAAAGTSRRLVLAGSTALAIIAATALVVLHRSGREQALTAVQELRRDERALQRDLEQLRRLRGSGAVYLGGDDRGDIVLDLSATPALRPASYSIDHEEKP